MDDQRVIPHSHQFKKGKLGLTDKNFLIWPYIVYTIIISTRHLRRYLVQGSARSGSTEWIYLLALSELSNQILLPLSLSAVCIAHLKVSLVLSTEEA